MQIYYAHHIWKYGTKIEEYELNLIKNTFPNARIFNPSTDIDQTLKSEDIMNICLKAVSVSDMVVFSSMNGCIGIGVFEEINLAYQHNIKVGYIFANQIQDYNESKFKQTVVLNNGENPRVYMALS